MNVFELVASLSLNTSAYENGLTNAESKTSSVGSKIGSALGSVAKVGAAALTAAAGAVTALTTQSLEAYSNYEQLVGGVETLFGDAADQVMQNAEQAYKTAGLSTNEYMETITSFAASLKQSVETEAEAAEVADMAVTDMSDNANKMGTSMESIQNAYQGFAKQNYTMLDNLKLGYGGTKEEMERLLEDAQELSGVEYDIDNLSDVYNAIHVIQEDLGITGTTAKEATETIQGSVSMLQSAWTNLLTGLGDADADVSQLASDVVESAGYVLDNAVPIIENIVEAIPDALTKIVDTIAESDLLDTVLTAASNIVTSLCEALPTLLQTVMDAIVNILPTLVSSISGMLPTLINCILDLITELVSNLDTILEPLLAALPDVIRALLLGIADHIGDIVSGLVDCIMMILDHLPEIIEAIIECIPTVIVKIIAAIIQNLPRLIVSIVECVGKIILAVFNALGTLWGQYIQPWFNSIFTKIGNWFSNLWSSIGKWFSELVGNVGKWAGNIITSIGNFFKKAWELGKSLVTGLWDGIKNAASWLWEKITGWITGIWDGIKEFFGIHSPSKQMAWAGKMLVEGFGNGISKYGSLAVNSAMDVANKISDVFNDDIYGSAPDGVINVQTRYSDSGYNQSLDAYRQAISESGLNGSRDLNVVLELNKQQFGRAVYKMNNEETQRVGMTLAGGYA